MPMTNNEFDKEINTIINRYVSNNSGFIPLGILVNWVWTIQTYNHLIKDFDIYEEYIHTCGYLKNIHSLEEILRYKSGIVPVESYSAYCKPEVLGITPMEGIELVRVDTAETTDLRDIILQLFKKRAQYLNIPIQNLSYNRMTLISHAWFITSGYKDFYIYHKKYI